MSGLSDELNAILGKLRALSLQINPNPEVFTITASVVDDDIGIRQKIREGIEVDIDEIDIDPTTGAFTYRGYHVLLYIPDQGGIFDDVINGINEGRKYHLTDCKTIEDMKAKNRFTRYKATDNRSGEFDIHGFSKTYNQNKTAKARLYVCKNCLSKLNYQDYNNNKGRVYQSFTLNEYFEHYETHFKTIPKNVGQNKAGYRDDWKDVSRKKRESVNYCCERCGVNLSAYKSLLDTHHRNGVPHDNSDANLQALCKICHAEEPLHEHYLKRLSYADKQKILELRRQQGV